MALKLVLVSPENTIASNETFDIDLINSFCELIKKLAAAGIRTAIWSNKTWRFNNINISEFLTNQSGVQVDLVGLSVGMPARQTKDSVNPILTKYGVKLEETVLVGSAETDLIAGKNNRLLLLRADWYENKIDYGFGLKSIKELERFCLLFGNRSHYFYWQVNEPDENLNLNTLGPYSTHKPEFATFGGDAFKAAKFEKGTLDFWHHLITSTLYFSGIIHKVDYITVYPGHAGNKKVQEFYEALDILGKCFGKTFYVDLILRHTAAAKSATTPHAEKTFLTQINTIHLNNYPSKLGKEPNKSALRLKDKCVLVVDDICTNGRSLDTARAYLSSAGAKCILFCWLKAIHRDYLRMVPMPEISPYKPNALATEPGNVAYGYHQHIVDTAAATEIDTLLSQFRAWV